MRTYIEKLPDNVKTLQQIQIIWFIFNAMQLLPLGYRWDIKEVGNNHKRISQKIFTLHYLHFTVIYFAAQATIHTCSFHNFCCLWVMQKTSI